MKPFLRGIGSVFDLWPTPYHVSVHRPPSELRSVELSYFRDDSHALFADLNAVGSELRSVIRSHRGCRLVHKD